MAPFCRCIEELLRTARDNDESEPAAQFFTETLQQMMMASTKADELVFLDGNPKRVLVDGYWSHYLTTCIVLPHATHFFDNEFRVSEALSGTTNCVFVDSKSEPLIQLSDVWVGLLSRLYQFLDEQSLNYRQIDAVRAAPQLENLRTIKRLIDRPMRPINHCYRKPPRRRSFTQGSKFCKAYAKARTASVFARAESEHIAECV